MSSDEDDPPHIHCSRFPQFNTCEYDKGLQVRSDDERPEDFYGMSTLRVHIGDRLFVCDHDGCNNLSPYPVISPDTNISTQGTGLLS
ncbi:hypothetical protein, partial [Sansalvadorimonas verongulae]|uniref:hypothetical protein n=1 Tax=Sansalvadorimonas verongulae TaxID=2172824 RepID=UPI001E4CE027